MILKAYTNLLEDVFLFRGATREELERLIQCVNAQTEFFERNDIIVGPSEAADKIFIVVSGEVAEYRCDVSGVEKEVSRYTVGEMFGELNAAVGVSGSSQIIRATENSAIVAIEYKKLLTPCEKACGGHIGVIENMVSFISRKNLLVQRQLDVLSKLSIREKILCFLEIQREMASADEFIIPYSRETLSKYLCVDRSALSRELGRMKNENLIDFYKSRFKLIPQNKKQDRIR